MINDCEPDRCLRLAAESGNIDKVLSLITTSNDLEGAACIAAEKGFDNIVTELVNRGNLTNWLQILVYYLRSGNTSLLNELYHRSKLFDNLNNLGGNALFDVINSSISSCNFVLLTTLVKSANLSGVNFVQSFYNNKKLGFNLSTQSYEAVIGYIDEMGYLDLSAIFIHACYNSTVSQLNHFIIKYKVNDQQIYSNALEYSVRGKNKDVTTWLWNEKIDKRTVNAEWIVNIYLTSLEVDDKYFIKHFKRVFDEVGVDKCAPIRVASLYGNTEFISNNHNNCLITQDIVNAAESGVTSTLDFVYRNTNGQNKSYFVLIGACRGSNSTIIDSVIESGIIRESATIILIGLLSESMELGAYSSVRSLIKFINKFLPSEKDFIKSTAINDVPKAYNEMIDYVASL